MQDADEKFREALGPLADLAEFFPELSLEISKSMRLLGIPRELMRGRVDGRRIWGGCASWRKFAEVEDFAGEHRHKAMKVKVKQGSNEELFALKEYDYDGGGGLQTCVREAALLVRLRHQHVVKVVSVFVDPNNSRFYMQMPYYSNGSLGDWIKNKSPWLSSFWNVDHQKVVSQSSRTRSHTLGTTDIEGSTPTERMIIHGTPRSGCPEDDTRVLSGPDSA